eukprot:29486-Pelagococcus_subviridis.AAC.3
MAFSSPPSPSSSSLLSSPPSSPSPPPTRPMPTQQRLHEVRLTRHHRETQRGHPADAHARVRALVQEHPRDRRVRPQRRGEQRRHPALLGFNVRAERDETRGGGGLIGHHRLHERGHRVVAFASIRRLTQRLDVRAVGEQKRDHPRSPVPRGEEQRRRVVPGASRVRLRAPLDEHPRDVDVAAL